MKQPSPGISPKIWWGLGTVHFKPLQLLSGWYVSCFNEHACVLFEAMAELNNSQVAFTRLLVLSVYFLFIVWQ